jgi:rubrerythrin
MEYLKSLDLAIANEKSEMDFYRSHAKRSRNPLTKTMFDTLAKDEEEHMLLIERLHEKLISKGQWPDSVPLKVNDTEIQHVMHASLQSAKDSAQHDMDDIAALQKSAEHEAKASRFYKKLAEESRFKKEENFFSFLAKIEKKHELALRDSLAYLEDPEGWSLQHERAGLDGA